MSESDDELRARITAMLEAGLATQLEPFPTTEKEFAEIAAELRGHDPKDVVAKLVIGGFINHPYGPDNWRCKECIYYLPIRKWCDLPELALPVEPEWYCRLWRM